MAFTESQMLAGGGIIAAKTAANKNNQKTPAALTPAGNTATYAQSVQSENASALSSSFSSAETQAAALSYYFAIQGTGQAAVNWTAANFPSLVGQYNAQVKQYNTNAQNAQNVLKNVKVYSNGSWSVNGIYKIKSGESYQSFLGSYGLVDVGGNRWEYSPYEANNLTAEQQRLNSFASAYNKYVSVYNSSLNNKGGVSTNSNNGNNESIGQWLTNGISWVWKGITTPSSYTTAAKDISSGASSLYLWSTSKPVTTVFDTTIPNFFASIGKTATTPSSYTTAATSLINIMNAPVNFAGFSTQHLSNILLLAATDNLFELNNIYFSPKKFNSFVSQNQKAIEIGGLMALSVGASVLTFGVAAPALGAAIGGTLVDLGVSEATAGGIATLTAGATAGALSSTVGEGVNIGGNILMGNKMSSTQIKSNLENAALFGAIMGEAITVLTPVAQYGYATLRGIPIAQSESFLSFAAKNPTNDFVENFNFGNPAKYGSIFIDKATGEPVLDFYNSVNMGNGFKAESILNYLKSIKGDDQLQFGSAMNGIFKEGQIYDVQAAGDFGNTISSGVRANINLGTEGIYANVPGAKNLPIFLNYVQLEYSFGSKIESSVLESLRSMLKNPFKSYSGFGTFEGNPSEFGTANIGEVEGNIGSRIGSAESIYRASNYLDYQAGTEGTPFRFATQNFEKGGSELQVELKVGTTFMGSAPTKTLFISKGFFPRLTFANVQDFQVLETGAPVAKIVDFAPSSASTTALNPANAVSSTFFSGGNLIDPFVSVGSAGNINGFSKIHSLKTLSISSKPSKDSLIGMPNINSNLNLNSADFLPHSVVSFPNSISPTPSKSSLYPSISSSIGYFLSDLSSSSPNNNSSPMSSSSSNNSPPISSSLLSPSLSSSELSSSSLGFDDSWWYRAGALIPNILLPAKPIRSKSREIKDLSSSKYTPSLAAEFFGITAPQKAIKKQNAKGGVLNSFIRPIIR